MWVPVGDQTRVRNPFGFETFDTQFTSGIDVPHSYVESIDVVWKQEFIDAVRALAPARSVRGGDEEDGALAVAALAHGLVGESIDEGLGLRDVVEDPWSPSRQQMTRRVTEILVHGLVE